MNNVPADRYTDAAVRDIEAMQSAGGSWPANESRRPPMASGDLRLRDVLVMDAHDLLNNLTGGQGFTGMVLSAPPIAPVLATVSFDIEWSGVVTSGKVVNEMQTFRGNY